VESASSGLLTGLEVSRELKELEAIDFPNETAIGSLALYTSGGSVSNFQPMNVNFGIIKPLDKKIKGKRDKNMAISERALAIIDEIIQGNL